MAQGFARGPKFLRLHQVGYHPNGGYSNVFDLYGRLLKATYEFWGFCVNGGTSLTGAQGFPSASFHSWNSDFENGTSLLLSGSDGSTMAGTPYFSSSVSNFNDLTGSVSDFKLSQKYLVTWKSGSTSTDDSIYKIKQVLSSGVLWVDTNTGATPWTGSQNPNKPVFTSRSDINYRVVDMQETIDSNTFVSGQFMVMQFDGAPEVNEGQSKSQIKFGIRNSSIAWQLSPSGSWNGSSFTDGGIEYYPSTADGQNSGEWGGIGTTPEIGLTLIADRGFMFFWLSGQHSPSAGSQPAAFIHVEIPERLYDKSVDPNPIAAMGAYSSNLTIQETNNAYGGGWYIHDRNNTSRRHRIIIKSPTNDHFGSMFESNRIDTPIPRSYGSFYDVFNDRIWFSEGLLYYGGHTDHFSLARCRLRSVRFVPKILSNNTLVGTDEGNQWYHIFNSIMLPWDGAILPRPLNTLGRI